MSKIVYVHGHGESTPELPMKAQWDRALGIEGGLSSIVYWADLCQQSELSEREAIIVRALHRRPGDLEDFNRRYINDLLNCVFDESTHKAIAARSEMVLNTETKVVVCHGLGALFALEVLRHREVELPLFVSIGTPLGEGVLQECLHFTYESKIVPECIKRWFNFSDRSDPLCKDGTLNDDFDDERITDCLVVNFHNQHEKVSTPAKANSAIGYLSLKQISSVIEEVLNE